MQSLHNNRNNNNINKNNINKNNSNNNNYNHVLLNIQDYMLTNKVLVQSLKYKLDNKKKQCIVKKEIKGKNISKKEKEQFFFPPQKDSLFWCFYIIKNGFASYEYPGITTYEKEKEEKFKCIEFLRKNKDALKTNKIKRIKEDVEDELANKDKIGMKTFIALCAVNNINVLFIHKRKCFELISDANVSLFHVVHCRDLNYCYEQDATIEQVDYYRNNYFKWESVDKPLKAISSYKSEELITLCKKLNLDGVEKKNKKELYELIILNI